MLNSFNLSLTVRKTAIETWAQKMNGVSGTNCGAQRAEQFPHLGIYTLTPSPLLTGGCHLGHEGHHSREAMTKKEVVSFVGSKK